MDFHEQAVNKLNKPQRMPLGIFVLCIMEYAISSLVLVVVLKRPLSLIQPVICLHDCMPLYITVPTFLTQFEAPVF